MDDKLIAIVEKYAKNSKAQIRIVLREYEKQYGKFEGSLSGYFRKSQCFEFHRVGPGKHEVSISGGGRGGFSSDEDLEKMRSAILKKMESNPLKEDKEAIANWNVIKQYVLQKDREAKTSGGKDILYYDSGEKMYEGDVVDGRKEGFGVEYYTSGEVKYEGDFKNNNFHGKGKYKYLSGESYDGDWNMSKKHGHGVYSYIKNQFLSYGGDWDANMKHGDATLLYDHNRTPYGAGSYIETVWRKNKMVKIGKCVFKARK